MRRRRIIRLLVSAAAVLVVVGIALALDGRTLAAILRAYVIVAAAFSTLFVAVVAAFDFWRRH